MLMESLKEIMHSKSLRELLGALVDFIIVAVMEIAPFGAITFIAPIVLKEYGWRGCIVTFLGMFCFYLIYLHELKEILEGPTKKDDKKRED